MSTRLPDCCLSPVDSLPTARGLNGPNARGAEPLKTPGAFG